MRRSSYIKCLTLRAAGVLLCILPVTAAIISYFPLWGARGSDAALSGFSVLLLTLAALPLFRLIKHSVSKISAHTVWFIIFVIFFIASRIADEMTVISFVGFLGNLAGAALFRLARGCGRREKDVG